VEVASLGSLSKKLARERRPDLAALDGSDVRIPDRWPKPGQNPDILTPVGG